MARVSRVMTPTVRVLAALGLVVALLCAALLLERDGGAATVALRKVSGLSTASAQASTATSRVDKTVARVMALKFKGSPAVAKAKAKAIVNSEVRGAVSNAKEKFGAKASQFNIGAIVCPILLQLRAAFSGGPLGAFFAPVINALLRSFGCTIPSP